MQEVFVTIRLIKSPKESLMNVKQMTLIALFAAVTCVLSIVTIPLGPVPFTLQVFAVVLAGAILGGKMGLFSQLIYTLIGAIGLPVFSGMKGGIGVIVGPTGGYIIGFILAAGFIGFGVQWGEKKFIRPVSNVVTFCVMVLGLIVIYGIGMVQLAFVLDMGMGKAFAAGVAPFLLPDFLKVVAAFAISLPIRATLKKAGLMPVLAV